MDLISNIEPLPKKSKTINGEKEEFCVVKNSSTKENSHEQYKEKYNSTVSTAVAVTYDNNANGNLSDDNSDKKDTSRVEDDDDGFTFPPDEDISDMLDGVYYNNTFPTIIERYFTAYYKIDVQRPEDDICIWIHSNRICMLSLAPSHIIFQENRKITKVDFKVSEKLNRALNKVSGKSKHGAQPLQTNSNICMISCSDGETYMIKCCIIGKLVEVNEMLLENPELLRQSPHKGGYLAIVLPNLKLLDKVKETLLTPEKYKEFVTARTLSKEENKI